MEGLRDGKSPADIAARHHISPQLYYRWRRRFLTAGALGFAPGTPEKDAWSGRRRHDRIDASVPTRIELLATEKEQTVLNLFTRNISAGGAYFHTSQVLPESTRVQLDIILPLRKINSRAGSEHVLVKVNGTVRLSGEEGMAIEFEEDYKVYRLRK